MCEVFDESFWTFLIGMFMHDDKVFGIQFDRNEVLRLDEKEDGLQLCGVIPIHNYDASKFKLYHRVFVEGEKAFFIPFMSKELCIYDFQNHRYRFIALNINKDKACEGQGMFYEGVLYNDYIILLPFTYREVIIIDLNTEKQLTLDIEFEFPKCEDEFLFRSYVWNDNDTIIVPSLSSNKCLIINLNTLSLRVIRVGSAENKYGAAITVEGKNYLLVKNYLKIVELDDNFNALELDCFDDVEWDGVERTTYFDPESVIAYDNYIYCFPAKWNHAIKIDLINSSASILNSIEPYCGKCSLKNDISIFNGAIYNGQYVYLQYQLDMILRFDLKSEQIKEYSRKICDNNMNRLRNYIEMVVDGDCEKLDNVIFGG